MEKSCRYIGTCRNADTSGCGSRLETADIQAGILIDGAISVRRVTTDKMRGPANERASTMDTEGRPRAADNLQVAIYALR